MGWFQIPGLNLVPNITEEEDREDGSEGKTIYMPSYTVFLRGPDLATLKLAKRCFKLALLSCFNARLEMAYLSDAQIVLTGDPSITSVCLHSSDMETIAVFGHAFNSCIAIPFE